MAHKSKEYRIYAEYHRADLWSNEYWYIVVTTKGLFGRFIGKQKIWYKPTAEDLENYGRQLIDKYLLEQDNYNTEVVNVRPP